MGMRDSLSQVGWGWGPLGWASQHGDTGVGVGWRQAIGMEWQDGDETLGWGWWDGDRSLGQGQLQLDSPCLSFPRRAHLSWGQMAGREGTLLGMWGGTKPSA